MSDGLWESHCRPCEGIGALLDTRTAQTYLGKLEHQWELIDGKKIKRTFTFPTFRAAIQFVNTIADLAEAEGHHPDLSIRYTKVIVTLSTHVICGLSENDFIMAAKIDTLQPRSPAEAS